MKKLLFIVCCSLIFFSCGSKEDKGQDDQVYEIDYQDYIAAYTMNNVSIQSNIQISLNNSNEYYRKPEQVELEKAIKISGKIEAGIELTDMGVIIITPKENLPYDTEWRCDIDLTAFFTEIEKDKSHFSFEFYTSVLRFDSGIEGLYSQTESNTKVQKAKAYIKTSDYIDPDKIEEMLTVFLDGKQVVSDIVWDHVDAGDSWIFIENIAKTTEEQDLKIVVNGKPIGLKEEQEDSRTISALGEFKFLEHSVQQDGQKMIKLNFSSPVKRDQQLSYIISLEGDNSPRITLDGSSIRIYPSVKLTGKVKVRISGDLFDANDIRLLRPITIDADFDRAKPSVSLVGNEGIMPGSDYLNFSFDAVTLKSVTLNVQEIPQNNILQHLQVNSIAGSNEIYRVGPSILTKKIDLDLTKVQDPYTWNRYYVNLADLIKVNTGSLYYVKVSFDISDSIYENLEGGDPESVRDEQNRWEYRNDPTRRYYYSRYSFPSKMIYGSNIGIISKKSDASNLHVFVTDILTTNPIDGAQVTVYSYQKQVVGSGKTDSDGKIEVELDGTPFLVVVKKGDDTGYCKLSSGYSLSTSSFDTTGVKNVKGIKGFIYGDRGVWRPGDTIYLNFVLQDSMDMIPDGHPIILELRDPKGKLTKKVVRNKSSEPIYHFPVETSVDSETGNWNAYVKVGGASFSKSLKIETVKPNRLKIKLDFNRDVLTIDDKTLEGDLDIKWLHGAPGKDLRATFDLQMFPTETSFRKFSKYEFDDPGVVYNSSKSRIFDDRVDSQGQGAVSVDFSQHIRNNRSPGILKALFSGKAFEEGGNFSLDSFTKLFYPYNSYVGMKFRESSSWVNYFYVDQDYTVDIAMVDKEGKPVDSGEVEIKVYKMEWRWWWHRENQREDAYVSANSKNLVKTDTVSVRDGKAEWNLNFDKENSGRYYIRITDRNSGHSTGSIFYMRWPYWYWYNYGAGRNNKGDQGAILLQFASDKESYEIGDKAEITFPSSSGGRALISIENGSDILKTFWVETLDKETKASFDIVEGMAPGVYLNVTLLQPHSQTSNDLPIRLYGIIPVEVYDPLTKLSPVINTSDTYRPEKEVEITVSEENGKPMSYTLAVVDEGLLDLTRFATPNPWYSFYAREALGVRTWDIYKHVSGAFSGNYGSLLAVGGGGANGKDPQKANRFKPVVKFLGPFNLNRGEKKKHSFVLPPYIGSVRVMVTGASGNAYGSEEKAVPVKDPLMVLSTMPRVLGPSESLKLPVNVFAMEDNIKEVQVKIETSDLIKIIGDNQKTISFTSIGDETVYFDAETLSDIGIANVKVDVVSGSNKASTEVEIDVRASNPEESRVVSSMLNKGETWTGTTGDWALNSTRSMHIELSRIPAIDMERRLKYLIRYPHGCLEQTMSKVFPQLFIGDITELTTDQKDNIENNVKVGIEKLKKFQRNDGGFGFWYGSSSSSPWGSNYAGHFILEAKKRGYSIPQNMLNSWINFQKKEAKEYDYYNYNRHINQAYRLYTLALAGKPHVSAMNRLYSNKNKLDDLDRSRLASAFALTGREDVAKELIKSANWRNIKDYRGSSYSYGSGLRDKAMILEAMVHTNYLDGAIPLIENLASALSSNNYWMSTQTTAYCLIAIGSFSKQSNPDEPLTFSYDYGDGGNDVVSEKNVYLKEIPYSNDVEIKNTMDQPLYARVVTNGIATEGEERDEQKNINMSVKYVFPDKTSVDRIPQGTDFYAEVTVSNSTSRGIEDLALSMIFPSGWEILNTRLYDTSEYRDGSDKPEFTDIKDDRVYMYFDLAGDNYRDYKKTKTFKVMLNASYVGEFYLPGVSCEAMYDGEVYSYKKGRRVKVVKAVEDFAG